MLDRPLERRDDPLELETGEFRRHRVETDRGVALRVFDWRPQRQEKSPVVFVGGWITLVKSWQPVLRELAVDRRVVYIESREKESARIERGRMRAETFAPDKLGADIAGVCRELDLDSRQAVFVASSLGANGVLEALKMGMPCRTAVLIGPNAEFAFPWWAPPLMRVPAAAYRALMPFVKWYLIRFRVDSDREPEQVQRYQDSLAAVDLRRLKLSAMALVGYDGMAGLDRIRDPVAVAFAGSDRLHGEHNARRLASSIPLGFALECPSNAFMHEAPMVAEIDRWVDGLDGLGR